jgi:hypothetical protein
MTLDDFRQSLTVTDPSAGLTPAHAGLWWDAKGHLDAGTRVSPARRRPHHRHHWQKTPVAMQQRPYTERACRLFSADRGRNSRSPEAGGNRVPETVSAIADAVRWAEPIMDEIDRRWPVKGAGE